MSMLPLVVQAHHPTVPPSWNLRDHEVFGELESRLTALNRHISLFHPSQHHQPSHGPTRQHRGLPQIATGATRPAVGAPTGPRRFPRQTPTGTRFAGGHLGTGLPHPEHSLRRKTPSGTIDAGYDGSPAQLSQGPPPLKHMLLQGPVPAAPQPSPYHASMHNVVVDGLRPPYHPTMLQDTLIAESPFPGVEYSYTTPPLHPAQARFQSMTGVVPDLNAGGPSHYSIFDALSPAAAAAAAAAQAMPAPAIPPGFLHNYVGPSLATDSNRLGDMTNLVFPVDGRPAWEVPPEATPPHDYVLSNHHYASQAGPPRAFAAAPLLNTAGFAPLQSPMTFMGTGLVSGSAFGLGPSEPVGFKDRVLAQAYSAYMEIAAHAASGSNASILKSGSSHSPRTPVFPQAPKISGMSWDVASAAGMAGMAGMAGSAGIGLDGTHTSQYAYNAAPNMAYPFSMPAGTPAMMNAQSSLEMVTNLCEQSKWAWIDGLLIGGCLLHALGRFEQAIGWFSKVETLDQSRVDAISNMAASLYCLDRHHEAEAQWLKAIRLRPDHLEAIEHLVAVLYRRKAVQAVQVIQHVQQSLRLEDGRPPQPLVPHVDTTNIGFGSSGYALAGSENGRMLALIHAKATLLYSLKQTSQAAEAFEEAVLISTGRSQGGIRMLVQRIQAVLRQGQAMVHASDGQSQDPIRSLLLLPARAKCTASLVFSGSGDMPGLRFMADSIKKRSAVFTTSNSLLSLAKIFQDSMSTGSSGGSSFGVADILALYYLSLSLHESPSTANNVGILLAGVQQPAQNKARAPVLSSAQQSLHGAVVAGAGAGTGIDYALEYYKYGLALDPGHVHLLTNYGSLLKDVGMLDAAIQKYEQAVARDPKFDIALTNLANAVKDRGRVKDAIVYYRRAVDANPNFAEAVCGLSTALSSVCDWKRRGGVYVKNGRYDRWHVGADGELQDVLLTKRGSGVMQRVADIVKRQLDEASRWGSGVLQAPVIELLASRALIGPGATTPTQGDVQMQLLRWSGRPWEGSQIVRYVERVTRVKMRQWYIDRHERRMASTADAYLRPRLPEALTVPTAPTVLPFHTFTCPLTARDIRTISQRNALRISCTTLKSSWLPDTVYPPPRPPAPHLNIGYVSSDFNNHPLAHLMQSVFGLHDPAKAKAHCYATTPSDGSIHRRQIESQAPVFRDVSSWSSQEIVDQIVRDGIHILVNLNGYTRGARNEIFAARPAPIQMSFMGFAGTLGAEWCDYLLADETAVPRSTLRPMRSNITVTDVFEDGMYEEEEREDDWVYSENLIYCRDTFFCCDHAQSCDPLDRMSTWEDEQQQRWDMRRRIFPRLPDNFIILGNFNQLYKIEPTTFRSWLRILSRVPNAILWLLKFPDLGEENLRKAALDWCGAAVASRIVFTDVAPKQEHISRARVCDLFLDTPECNAHTTAADILWSSTPLLTLPRYPYKMCSRMAASILKGALPRGAEGEKAAAELIASDEDEYEAFAIRLASGLKYTMVPRASLPPPPLGTSSSSSLSSSFTANPYMHSPPYGEASGRLAELRRLLFDSKWTCALFDTKRWVSELERAYAEAWRHWVTGEQGDIFL